MSSAQLLPNVFQTWQDSNGSPLNGGKLYSYAAGTVTPQATYTDEGAGTANANPVVLNSAGQASVWLRTDLSYKLVMKDSLNNVLWTSDHVNIVNPGSIDNTKIAANLAGVGLAQNLGTLSIDAQVDQVTIDVNGSNQLEVKDGGLTKTKFLSTALAEVVFKGPFDCTGYGMHAVPQFPWSAPTLLSNPSNLPGSGPSTVAWSPNGEFLVTCSVGGSSQLVIYQRTGDTLTKLADPLTMPGTDCHGVCWSPDSQFLSVTSRLTPFITIYQRSGTTFTKLADPGTIPSTSSLGGAFSPNGEFIVIGNSGTLFIYQITGSTFTSITAPSFTGGAINKLAWSPDGQYLCVTGDSTPYINIFQRVDKTFTKLADPSTIPNNVAYGVAWSPDGKFLAVGEGSSPYMIIYSISGITFTKVTDPLTLPPSAVLGFSWSPNSLYLAAATSGSPYVSIYQVSGTTFTKLADPSSLVNGAGSNCDWSPNGQYLAVIETSSPYLQIYKTASSLPSNAILWARSILNV